MSKPPQPCHTSKRPRRLGEQLWTLVERVQGYAFISDIVEEYSDADALRVAENTLAWQKSLNRKLAAWIRKNRKES